MRSSHLSYRPFENRVAFPCNHIILRRLSIRCNCAQACVLSTKTVGRLVLAFFRANDAVYTVHDCTEVLGQLWIVVGFTFPFSIGIHSLTMPVLMSFMTISPTRELWHSQQFRSR